MARHYGLFVLGRPTFDKDYASARAEQARAALAATGTSCLGDPSILFDNAAVARQIEAIADAEPAGIIVVQATFTDAEAVCSIAERFAGPIHIWALPEPRSGGRLRLNAFCGLNLAAHALGLRNRDFVGLYADPAAPNIGTSIEDWLGRTSMSVPATRAPRPRGDGEAGMRGAAALEGARVARIGARPAGFDTCAYDETRLAALAGITVEPVDLADLFRLAAEAGTEEVASLQRSLAPVAGLDAVDQVQLDKSLRLRSALEHLRTEGRYSGFAVRCWPETFTEYGGAVCGPVALMGEQRTPCACEADVYGALTSLMLQEIAEAPVFLADVVDMDAASDTMVVWHCGQAPRSMADPAAPVAATIHSNRRMPLLFQFALKPGRVTLARISQARGETSVVVATGEVLTAPPSFSGTSGVVRLDRSIAEVRDRFLGGAVEHHLALAYGEHAAALEHTAHTLRLPVLDLTK